MSLERNDSQQTTCNATAIIDGERRQVASASVSIRPGKGMSVSVDLQATRAQLTDDDFAEIVSMFAGYLAEEINKANGLGIPVALPVS